MTSNIGVGVGVSTNPLEIATLSGIKTSDTLIPTEESTRESNRKPIPRHHFKIRGESFMIASHDDEEPNTITRLSHNLLEIWG